MRLLNWAKLPSLPDKSILFSIIVDPNLRKTFFYNLEISGLTGANCLHFLKARIRATYVNSKQSLCANNLTNHWHLLSLLNAY